MSKRSDDIEKGTILDSSAKAVARLLSKRAISEITVKELCAEAGISRMTYYRNFSSIEDILKKYLVKQTERFKKEVMKEERFGSYIRRENILIGFRYLKENSDLILCMLNQNLGDLLRNNMVQEELNLSYRSQCSEEDRYITVAYANTLFGIYTTWLKDGMKESPEKLTDLILDLFQSRLRRY